MSRHNAHNIQSLADYPNYIATIGRWHWQEWGHADPEGTLESWIEGIAGRANRDVIPTTLVALDGDELMGSVCLVESDMDIRKALTPWVAGLLVAPDYRNQGVGTSLMEHAMAFARELGVPKLYLYTATAEAMYHRIGWRTIETAHYEGDDVAIMVIELGRQVD